MAQRTTESSTTTKSRAPCIAAGHRGEIAERREEATWYTLVRARATGREFHEKQVERAPTIVHERRPMTSQALLQRNGRAVVHGAELMDEAFRPLLGQPTPRVKLSQECLRTSESSAEADEAVCALECHLRVVEELLIWERDRIGKHRGDAAAHGSIKEAARPRCVPAWNDAEARIVHLLDVAA